ncbi:MULTISPECIES: hypothetical protein [Streptomyces]|nr:MULTISPECIES: hypothetical protein [Streptomyces]
MGELDGSFSVEETEQLTEQLDENIAVIEQLLDKLKAHIERDPHA